MCHMNISQNNVWYALPAEIGVIFHGGYDTFDCSQSCIGVLQARCLCCHCSLLLLLLFQAMFGDVQLAAWFSKKASRYRGCMPCSIQMLQNIQQLCVLHIVETDAWCRDWGDALNIASPRTLVLAPGSMKWKVKLCILVLRFYLIERHYLHVLNRKHDTARHHRWIPLSKEGQSPADKDTKWNC